MATSKEYKVILVGSVGVGKSAYLQRFAGGEFLSGYKSDTGANVKNLDFHTSAGKLVLNVWDVAGYQNLEGLSDNYYVGADAAIIMFDVTNMASYKLVSSYYKYITRICGNIPVVLVGNKCDVLCREVMPRVINIHRVLDLKYYEVSVKGNYNYEKPLLAILRALSNDQDLNLTEEVPTAAELVV